MSETPGAAVVRGTVRGPDGGPVAGARVVVTASPVPVPEIAVLTDAAGRFAFIAPAPGAYAFAAHADHLAAPATASLRVPAPPSPPAAAPTLSRAATDAAADDDADMSSDDPAPRSAPAAPAAEVHIVLTFPGMTGEPA